MDESQRHGHRDEASASDDEGEKQLKIEATPAPEGDRQQSLPVRPHDSNMAPPEHDRGRLSPANAPAW